MELALYWNDVAIEANRLSFTNLKEGENPEQGGPTLGSRALAIVHLSMHDAYKGISATTSFDFYLKEINRPELPLISSSNQKDAANSAISAAAHTALLTLYPKQKAFFDTKLHSITHLLNYEDAFQYGCEVARTILKLRKSDPNNSDEGYVPHVGKGKHRSDPNNPQGYLGPFYGNSKLFSANERHNLVNTPFFQNNVFSTVDSEYIRALKQVSEKGIVTEQMGTLSNNANKRTNEESLIGIFWAYDGANSIGTPPRLFNQIVRTVATSNLSLTNVSKTGTDFNSLTERNIRLFALVNCALADAGILAWEQKYLHNLWRPVIGIREHDNSMGPTGNADATFNENCNASWLPLGAPKSNANGSKNFTPDFPSYPSGHATFGAAALHITRLFFGVKEKNRKADDLFKGCEFVSDEFNGVTKDNNNTVRPTHKRKFKDGLWGMIIENGLSRVYLGVHWSYDAFKLKSDNSTPVFDKKIGGVDLGLVIAEDIFKDGMNESDVAAKMH